MMARSSATRAPFVAVAGLSARMLAQSAARAGLRVVALDVFGDRDTREAAELWFDIGGGPLSIDPEKLAGALGRCARLPGLIGWIDGSGLEPFIARLCEVPGLPRFIGNAAQASAQVRDPRRFFALLDELDIPHPPVALTLPAAASGWLMKRADGCGGTHVEPLATLATLAGSGPPAQAYFQRHSRGRPMSALFLAARGSARVIGFAQQLTCQMGTLPFVHAGSIGPVDLPPTVEIRVRAAIAALCARVGLAGINSCDFLLDGESFEVLEINTRPSSTMTLYETASPDAWPRGLVAAHIDACRHGRLPPEPAPAICRAGQQVLFAPQPFAVSQAFSDACARDPRCRDVPMPGTRIEAGQPVCTLLAHAPSVDAVRHALDAQHTLVLQRIESCREPLQAASPASPASLPTPFREPDRDFIHCHS
ncbi:ATP-grasp domain-containing protein [bacterium M00.F.Ca.ET.228.01.1.1]|uniref:ATP-grasp domain-containing protein n=1 Tax=Paraburkholderia phenoliruptrix TaxID=252970 RepID=UPI001092805F|nr:ATP-grasp domain-containing protein [Paraburkholderia phenoliruptrix]TGP47937.1 ATP-grasp domain-containing protein [bacterium M00.F.Ca.ET.228.01.1.1]TGS05729.1 ATP-grasp domain-containing protein [bacterium M00.F.Ca.ET.191.01.1.1]TGU10666.1 ATP-grasp domain-containing protein [bacterium M00.F.Ca.ET.155.01.1.1]MBW0445254.1 ATP-grasp domain-containing protein [Paraburkholderia phenoliruptrix]MBW9096019.1 ATP-grasp domain-containing protein [Paraburkholderia phenoliruptrix]